MSLAPKEKLHKIFVLYILAFVFSLHLAIPAYTNSNFLSLFSGETVVGLIYAASSAAAIAALAFLPRGIKRYGNRRTMIFLAALEFAALVGLVLSNTLLLIAPIFVISFVAIALVGVNFDVFLERYIPQTSMGKIRGIFLTSNNVAWIMAPLVASAILVDSNYRDIFIVAAALILPVLLLTATEFSHDRDIPYARESIWHTVREVAKDRKIASAFMVSFLMQFFFSWMVIYMPIYLHNYMQFEWKTLGIMFSIMLLPFVITEIPLGRLSDKYGEKEIMSLGFILMAAATATMSVYAAPNVVMWTALLFLSRVGASMVEVMSETYFFKVINRAHVSDMSLFRTMRPLAYLIAPVIASLLIAAGLSIQYLFLILGAVMLYGLRATLRMRDVV